MTATDILDLFTPAIAAGILMLACCDIKLPRFNHRRKNNQKKAAQHKKPALL